MRTLILVALLLASFSGQIVEAQKPSEKGLTFLAKVSSTNESASAFQVVIEPTGRNAVVNLGKTVEVFASMSDDSEGYLGKVNPISPRSSIVGKRVWVNALAGTTPSEYDAREVVVTERSGKEVEETKSIVKFLTQNEPAIAEEFYARLYRCGRLIDRATKLGLGNHPHILVGRIDFSGKEDPRSISSQFQVLDKGYFVTTCLDFKAPICIDLHGFKPNELSAKSSESKTENLGTLKLETATRKESSYLTFRLPKAIDAVLKDKPINLYTRPRSFNSAGTTQLFLPDSPSKVGVRRNKDGLYPSVPLSPGIKYEVFLSIGGKSYGAIAILKPGETRELGELQEISKENPQPKAKPIVPASPPESKEQKRDRQYNASIDQLKKIIAGYRERRQGGHVVAAKLRFENERNIDLSGKIASNFRYIPDGRIVGVIARADEPFFIRALGYRSKEVKIADYLSGFDSEAEFYDIGEIQLSKLSSDEECTITGNVACSDEKEAGKLQSSFEGSVRISANETRNSPGNALWGDSMLTETQVDTSGKFEIGGLSPGKYALVPLIQGFSDQFKECDVAAGSILDVGTIALDRQMVTKVSWIWSDTLPFANLEASHGRLYSNKLWYATSTNNSGGYQPSDLYCRVVQGKLYFGCTHCPANFADLGTGELSDFIATTLDQAKAKFGNTTFTQGHVYFVQQLHSKRNILMKVNSLDVVKPLDPGASQAEIAKWVIESGGRVGLLGRPDWIQDPNALPPIDSLRISKISFFPSSKPDVRILSKDLEALRSVSDLEELILRGQWVGDSGVKTISSLAKLKVLNLHDCKISDAALEDLSKLEFLVDLDVGYSNNRITDAGAEHLSKLSMLTALNIYNSNITDKTLLSVLAKLPKLRSVEITETPVSEKGIEEFKIRKPGCRVIKY